MNQTLLEEISIEQIRQIIKQLDVSNVFLVTDSAAFNLSGGDTFLKPLEQDVELTKFSEFEVNPKVEDVIRGVEEFKSKKHDLIIAIGGGSVVDMAKCINSFQANEPSDVLEFVRHNKIEKKGVPIIAIPTTSGSGSEATHFAVLYIEGSKYSLAHEYILPDYAGLNYKLTSTQPKYLTACSSMDALSQAIESYWSVGATSQSQEYSRKALSYLLPNIRENVHQPTKKTRHQVSLGAYYAGKAINVSKTTAAHAVSYAFTTHYSIPHGHAVFLTLPEFFEYNYYASADDVNNPKGEGYVKSSLNELCELLGVNTVEEGKTLLKQIAKDIGIELSLSKLGVKEYEDIIEKNVNTERLGNNPRTISTKALIEMLKSKDL